MSESKRSIGGWLKRKARRFSDTLSRSRSPTPSIPSGRDPDTGTSYVAHPGQDPVPAILVSDPDANSGALPRRVNRQFAKIQHVESPPNPLTESTPSTVDSTILSPQPVLPLPPLIKNGHLVARNPQEDVFQEKPSWVVAIQNLLSVVERALGIFPPLKRTVAGINALLDAKDAFSHNQEDFLKLSKRVMLLDEIFRGCPDSDLPQEIRDRRNGLARTIEELGEVLKEKTHRSGLKRAIYTRDDLQDIIRLVREMTVAIEFALLEVTVRNEYRTLEPVKGVTWLKERRIEEFQKLLASVSSISRTVTVLNKGELFTRLGEVDFTTAIGGRGTGCIPGSRITLLSQLLAWAEDRHSSHAFWLNGVAGAGKTSITETFCWELSNRGLLGASFFCSVAGENLNDVYYIIPTLAKGIAQAQPRFGDALANILENVLAPCANPLEMKLAEQFDYLILRPAALAFGGLLRPIVICIDALNECSNKGALDDFLDTVVLSKPEVPIKVFLSSRPERSIKARLLPRSNSPHRHVLRLHDLDDDIVKGDIALFLHRKLEANPALRQHYRSAWPPPEVDNIVERCGTLFIVAATIIRFVNGDERNCVDRLQAWGSTRAPLESGIQTLYRDVLDPVFAKLTSREEEDLHACLSLLVVACRALSVKEYAAFLNRPERVVLDGFKSLYSVIEINEEGLVTIHHASFVEFLTNPGWRERQGIPWVVDRVAAHSMAADLCLGLLDSTDRGVCFGISGAATSYRSNVDQALKLTSDLAYACVAWPLHAMQALPLTDAFEVRIRTFLENKGLFWIEALGVEQEVGSMCTNVLKDLDKNVRDARLKRLLPAISTFCSTFAAPINKSAPHLYLSVLPFVEFTMGPLEWQPSPYSSTPVVQHDTHRSARPNLGLCRAGESFNEVMTQPTTNREDIGKIRTVAISPDGSLIASGSSNGNVMLWDAHNGHRVLGPLRGHSDCVFSLAFSPDGSKFVSCSQDRTVMVWDTRRGQPALGPLQGHADWVFAVAFSPVDMRIASGSVDKTIRLWDTRSGEQLLDPIQGHTDWVLAVAFSPDGTRIASGSCDKMVRIWDARSGEPMLGPLRGHTGHVRSVAFSPDGSKIVSGADDRTVRVWDANTGKPIFYTLDPLNSHTQSVFSVAFSPDGSRIVSGSADKTIRIWDADSGKLVGQPLTGHTEYVSSVAFTPDRSRIVSGSWDATIRVWNLQASEDQESTFPTLLHQYPLHSAFLDHHSGWLSNPSGDLLLWVPDKFRRSLCFPAVEFIIGLPMTDIELTYARYHGSDWRRCIEPRLGGCGAGKPWPMGDSSTADGC